MFVREIIIQWPDADMAIKGHGHVMNHFCNYKSFKKPVGHVVDLLTMKYVIPTPNQEFNIKNRAAEFGGEPIFEDAVPLPTVNHRTSGQAYARTHPTQYDPDHFLSIVKLIEESPTEHVGSLYEYDGDTIRMGSLRYKNFLHHGIKCVVCGIEGKFFLKQKSHHDEPDYHMNLYALDEMGNRVLMTRDHIMPRSKGGPNTLENLQTMCSPCNGRKADKLPENFVPKAA